MPSARYFKHCNFLSGVEGLMPVLRRRVLGRFGARNKASRIPEERQYKG